MMRCAKRVHQTCQTYCKNAVSNGCLFLSLTSDLRMLTPMWFGRQQRLLHIRSCHKAVVFWSIVLADVGDLEWPSCVLWSNWGQTAKPLWSACVNKDPARLKQTHKCFGRCGPD